MANQLFSFSEDIVNELHKNILKSWRIALNKFSLPWEMLYSFNKLSYFESIDFESIDFESVDFESIDCSFSQQKKFLMFNSMEEKLNAPNIIVSIKDAENLFNNNGHFNLNPKMAIIDESENTYSTKKCSLPLIDLSLSCKIHIDKFQELKFNEFEDFIVDFFSNNMVSINNQLAEMFIHMTSCFVGKNCSADVFVSHAFKSLAFTDMLILINYDDLFLLDSLLHFASSLGTYFYINSEGFYCNGHKVGNVFLSENLLPGYFFVLYNPNAFMSLKIIVPEYNLLTPESNLFPIKVSENSNIKFVLFKMNSQLSMIMRETKDFYVYNLN